MEIIKFSSNISYSISFAMVSSIITLLPSLDLLFEAMSM